MNREHRNPAATRPVGHEIGRGEPADLAAVASLTRERPRVQSGRGVQDGDLGSEGLAAAVRSRAHPINLLLHRPHHLIVAREREEPVVGGDQQRHTVVPEQRTWLDLASSTRRERVKVLAKPPAHVTAVHAHGPYLRRSNRGIRKSGPYRDRTCDLGIKSWRWGFAVSRCGGLPCYFEVLATLRPDPFRWGSASCVPPGFPPLAVR
jgi:hypothetical protein